MLFASSFVFFVLTALVVAVPSAKRATCSNGQTASNDAVCVFSTEPFKSLQDTHVVFRSAVSGSMFSMTFNKICQLFIITADSAGITDRTSSFNGGQCNDEARESLRVHNHHILGQ